MKWMLIALLVQLAGFAFCDAQKSFESLTTLSGKTYSSVVVTSIGPSGIRVRHSSGLATISMSDLPENVKQQFLKASDGIAAAMVEGLTEGKEYDVAQDLKLRSSASPSAKMIVNEKATRLLDGVHYLSIDTSTTVKILELGKGWVKIQVTEPDYLSDSHVGWIPATALARGENSKKLSGWIRDDCVVYSTNDKTMPIGRLKSPSSVGIADDGSAWLRLVHGPVRNLSSDEFIGNGYFEGGAYIEKASFTTTPPANW